jgi:hypothetical protein
MLQRSSDLRGQSIVQTIDQITHMVGDVADVQALAATIAGVQDVLQVFECRDHLVVLGQWAMPQVIDRGDAGIGLDNLIGQVG